MDLWVQADPVWKRWRQSLSPTQKTFLRIWRGGAVKTRSRRWCHSRHNARHLAQCECGAPARHLWAECSSLQGLRLSLQQQYSLPPAWWAAQPKITPKSGWVTLGSRPTFQGRVQAQIASCLLGVAVAELGATVPDTPDLNNMPLCLLSSPLVWLGFRISVLDLNPPFKV